jgi:hypothetical protein
MRADEKTWFTARRAWDVCWMFGIGLGWGKDGLGGVCLIIEVGPYVVLIGPHYKREMRK